MYRYCWLVNFVVTSRLLCLFLGEETVIAHNATFDMGMIWIELSRMEMEFHFPWPRNWFCTVEKSMYIQHKRLTLKKLHELATGGEHKNQHTAKGDVQALVRCYKWLKSKEENSDN